MVEVVERGGVVLGEVVGQGGVVEMELAAEVGAALAAGGDAVARGVEGVGRGAAGFDDRLGDEVDAVAVRAGGEDASLWLGQLKTMIMNGVKLQSWHTPHMRNHALLLMNQAHHHLANLIFDLMASAIALQSALSDSAWNVIQPRRLQEAWS
ncbi:MAG TPA: hypothetical protein PK490_00010 [Prosthecobacter sp.]|nr:hypothetical protein [Prosthecobacter sp.]